MGTFKGPPRPRGQGCSGIPRFPNVLASGALATPPGLPPGTWESIYFLRSEAGWLRPIVDNRESVAFATGVKSGPGPGALILADAIAHGQVFAEGRKHGKHGDSLE
jgi:hypothetical protein